MKKLNLNNNIIYKPFFTPMNTSKKKDFAKRKRILFSSL